MLTGLFVHSVNKLHILDHVGQALEAPQPAPVLLSAQPQLVHHGQQAGAADTPPRPGGAQAHRRKRGLNRIGGPNRRSRVFGARIGASPNPVSSIRAGKYPFRTRRRRPDASRSPSSPDKYVANSASTASCNNARAPSRNRLLNGSDSSAGFFKETTVSFFIVVYSSHVVGCLSKKTPFYNTGCTTSLTQLIHQK